MFKRIKICALLVVIFAISINAAEKTAFSKSQPIKEVKKTSVVGALTVSSVQELTDALVTHGLTEVLNRLQDAISAHEKLQNSGFSVPQAQPKKVATTRKKISVDAETQELMYLLLQRIVQAGVWYLPQSDDTTGQRSAILDQAIDVVVSSLQKSFLTEARKNDLIKIELPKLKTREFNADEVVILESLRSLGLEQELDNRIHPLQAATVSEIQNNLVRLKGKVVHSILIQRLNKYIGLMLTIISQPLPVAGLTKLASFEQIQLLQAAINESDILTPAVKDMAKLVFDRLVTNLSNVKALVTLLASQLNGDASATSTIRAKNLIQYMNRCDALFNQMPSISPDAYVDAEMQKLRNAAAKSIVELSQKNDLDVKNTLLPLLQRASETFLLGKSQRIYVHTSMLPKLDDDYKKAIRVRNQKKHDAAHKKNKIKK